MTHRRKWNFHTCIPFLEGSGWTEGTLRASSRFSPLHLRKKKVQSRSLEHRSAVGYENSTPLRRVPRPVVPFVKNSLSTGIKFMYAARLPTAFTGESCDFPSFHLSAFRKALRCRSKIIGGFQLKSFCLAMCRVIRISVAERRKNIRALVTLGEDLKYDERKGQQFLHKHSESRMICLLFVALISALFLLLALSRNFPVLK